MSKRSSMLGDSVRRHAFYRIAQTCLDRAHTAARRRIVRTAIGGLSLVLISPVVIEVLLLLVAHLEQRTINMVLVIWGIAAVVSALIALACRYQGMSFRETTGQIADDSLSHIDTENPLATFVILALLTLLTGGMWLIFHSIADWYAGWRLRNVDPARAGVIMSELLSATTCVQADHFRKAGESVHAFGIYPAYLRWLGLIRVYPKFGTLTTTPFARRLLTAG